MPYAGPLVVNPNIQWHDIPASAGQVLRAQRQGTLRESPLSSLGDLSDARNAELGEIIVPAQPEIGQPEVRGEVKRLSADEIRLRLSQSGIPLGVKFQVPDNGMPEKLFDLKVKEVKEEMRRSDIYSRGPQGIGMFGARLGVALATALQDPLNLASGLVPLVGPTRYGALLAGAGGAAGRAGVRSMVGAAEGAAGAMLLEPLIYSAAQVRNADYDVYDSLANIAFGGLFGGGLHVIGGAIGDRIRAPAIEAQRRADVLARAESEAESQRIDIEQRAFQERAETTFTQEQRMADMSRMVHGLAPEGRAAADAARLINAVETAARRTEEIEGRLADGVSRATLTTEERVALSGKGDIESLVPELKSIAETPAMSRAIEIAQKPGFLRTQEERLFLQSMREGYEPKLLNERVGDIERQIEKLNLGRTAANAAETDLAISKLAQERDQSLKRMDDLGYKASSAEAVAARISGETRKAALSVSVAQAVSGRSIDVESVMRAAPESLLKPHTESEMRAAAIKNNSVEARIGYEPGASKQADELIKNQRGMEIADVESEIADLEMLVREYQKSAKAKNASDELPDMKAIEAQIAKSEAETKALIAAASCGIG